MKNSHLTRAVAAATLITVAGAGCAWTFHPERRGNRGGEIAGAPLVGDILWFIPGILPGLIFLIVDFSSGAIYYGGHGGRYGQIEHTGAHGTSTSAQSTVIVPK